MVLLKSCCMILYNTLLNVLLFNFDFFFSHKGYTRTLYPEWRINLLLQVMSVPLETVFERMTSQMVVYWNDAGFALYNDELTLYPFVIPTLPLEYLYFYFHLYYLFLHFKDTIIFLKFQKNYQFFVFLVLVTKTVLFPTVMFHNGLDYPVTYFLLFFIFRKILLFSHPKNLRPSRHRAIPVP